VTTALDLDEITATLDTADSETTLIAALDKAAYALGFDYCAHGLRMPLPLSNPRTLMASTYPTAWQQRYAEQNYVALDPTVAHALRSTAPQVWSEPMFAQVRPFWEEARSHGLQVGWAQSSCDVQGNIGMLTLARSGEPLTATELRAKSLHLSWLAHAAHTAMSRIAAGRHHSNSAAAIELTAREAEMLRWTADGKTSGEIAQITAISERTVNFHLNNAVEKLGVTNKTAAAVKAAMLRLL
jgi:LuxR family transcriptional regulator, quorum-sensing system regulator SolR